VFVGKRHVIRIWDHLGYTQSGEVPQVRVRVLVDALELSSLEGSGASEADDDSAWISCELSAPQFGLYEHILETPTAAIYVIEAKQGSRLVSASPVFIIADQLPCTQTNTIRTKSGCTCASGFARMFGQCKASTVIALEAAIFAIVGLGILVLISRCYSRRTLDRSWRISPGEVKLDDESACLQGGLTNLVDLRRGEYCNAEVVVAVLKTNGTTPEGRAVKPPKTVGPFEGGRWENTCSAESTLMHVQPSKPTKTWRLQKPSRGKSYFNHGDFKARMRGLV
jgi:hypothetical protein